MKRHLIIIVCSLFPLMAMAQMRITGTVTDMNGDPLTGVIIQVRSNNTNKMIRFDKTDAKGSFTLEVTADSYLEVSMLGFKKQRINNPATKKFLRIVMQEEAIALKEVTVKASKVRLRGDTITYHIATFADQNDRSIGDVLAHIPGFEVNKQNGEIKYEGKPISKFYIEGLDMLGSKYGVATNSLPQVDIGTVEVMRNHQPVRVLEDFTFTDDAAVNIRMKEGAKSHWVTSYNGGAGISHNTGLWKLEGLALRLKSNFQTMFTYKTNNTGLNINKETTNLFFLDDFDGLNDYISLASPRTTSLSENRTLFNRSHAVTANAMKRLNDSAQINVQFIYNNYRESAQGERQTEYFLPDGNKVINTRKDFLRKDNELYALVKYEHNSERQYLKNSLSADLLWSRQWLDERGSYDYYQYARKPEYDIKDNLYIVRKYNQSLVSFYSNNRIISRPQSLTVSPLLQHISQQLYNTDTYAMGATKIGVFNLSLKAGVNAEHHRLESDLSGISDTIGLLSDDVRFSLVRLYVEPKITYKTRDIQIDLSPTTEYLYEKYSEDKGHHQMLFSPDLRVQWKASPRLKLSLGGSSFLSNPDPTRFYHALILQDYQYVNQGWTGYRHEHTWSIRSNITYSDALKAMHSYLTISRSFSTSPYTSTREFLDNYIILSATEQEAKSDAWQVTLIASKGLNFWNGVTSLRVIYTNNDASMLQRASQGVNDRLTEFNSQMLNARAGLDFSFWKDMHLRYGVTLRQNRMKMEQSPATNVHNWKHDMTLTLPLKPITFDITAEYYHNEITRDSYKDFFLADAKVGYKSRHVDLSLSLTNIFNRTVYSYVTVSDLISSSSVNHIRGRELLLTFYYML